MLMVSLDVRAPGAEERPHPPAQNQQVPPFLEARLLGGWGPEAARLHFIEDPRLQP